MTGVLIVGASGHGKVVADILQQQGIPLIGFLDDDPSRLNTHVMQLPVLGKINDFKHFKPSGLVMGIGDNQTRSRITSELVAAEGLWLTAIHPRAIIAPSTIIGEGSVIMAGAIINPDVIIGRHVIVNTGASIDHDCHIGDFAHLAPGSHLAGGVKIGQKTIVGIGSSIIQSITIGESVVIGAGAAVTRSIPEGVIAKGVPARW